MSNINLNLYGEYKVDIFNDKGELKRSSNYIKNFITNSGAIYPYFFAFADCFRYLSLGTGISGNSTGIVGYPATTGLSNGIAAFSYLGSGNYVTGGFLGGGCGNFANPNSNTVSLIRQWSIPDNSGDTIQASYPFTEIMVSPGRPYVTGWSSNTSFTAIATGACLCTDGVYSLDDGSLGSPDTFGLEGSQVAIYYSALQQLSEEVNSQSIYTNGAGVRSRLKMCDATYAFSRITGNFNIFSGEIMTITYQLNINFNTGIQTNLPNHAYTSTYYDTTNKNWASLGYVANITNPGIKLIVDGNIASTETNVSAPTGNRLQQLDYSTTSNPNFALYGESFVPSMGIPFEPSCIYGVGGNFLAYVSDDITQFAVSPTGGSCNTGLFKPWNTAGLSLPQNSGLLAFQTIINGNNSSLAIYSASTNYWSTNPYNIRQADSVAGFPSTGDVSITSSPIPNVYMSSSQSNSSFSLNASGRGGSISTNYPFVGYYFNNYGQVQMVKSYVIGYVDSAAILGIWPETAGCDFGSIMPFFDCLFSGISGSNNFLPIIHNGSQNNSSPTTITNAFVTGYNYLSGQTAYFSPTFNNQLTWVCDCPHGVSGCP